MREEPTTREVMEKTIQEKWSSHGTSRFVRKFLREPTRLSIVLAILEVKMPVIQNEHVPSATVEKVTERLSLLGLEEYSQKKPATVPPLKNSSIRANGKTSHGEKDKEKERAREPRRTDGSHSARSPRSPPSETVHSHSTKKPISKSVDGSVEQKSPRMLAVDMQTNAQRLAVSRDGAKERSKSAGKNTLSLTAPVAIPAKVKMSSSNKSRSSPPESENGRVLHDKSERKKKNSAAKGEEHEGRQVIDDVAKRRKKDKTEREKL